MPLSMIVVLAVCIIGIMLMTARLAYLDLKEKDQ